MFLVALERGGFYGYKTGMSKLVPSTLVEALYMRASDPVRGHTVGFRFLGLDQVERFYSYQKMLEEGLRRAAAFHRSGIKKGDRIALIVAENHEFVLSFWGATLLGAVPVPIFPRATFKAINSYAETVAHIIQTAKARVLLTMENTLEFVAPARALLEQAGQPLQDVWTVETFFQSQFDALPNDALPKIDPDDLCFLQFTSGSTSQPKGVMVSHQNLVMNAKSFLGPHGARRSDADVGVSWLPLYHDMGLIGFVLGTLIMDIGVVLLPTGAFIRSPRLWLDMISKHKATITYAPNFAYALIAKRLKDKDVAAFDLSHLRLAGCGAEPIRAQTLREFAQKLKPAGFSEKAFLPSYGMAESTLAITFHELGTPVITDVVDAAQLKQAKAVKVTKPRSDEVRTLELVSCGRPFPEHEVKVIREDGEVCAEREVGEVLTRGPSVCAGYFENPEATEASFGGGWLRTGDLGYFADGNLYICGRVKDLIIIRGSNHYPQDIEWLVSDLDKVRRGHVVAFSVDKDGEETLVIAAEGNSSDAAELRKAISEKVQEGVGLVPDVVAIVPLGGLPQTSSGKPQRRKTKQLFEEGKLQQHP